MFFLTLSWKHFSHTEADLPSYCSTSTIYSMISVVMFSIVSQSRSTPNPGDSGIATCPSDNLRGFLIAGLVCASNGGCTSRIDPFAMAPFTFIEEKPHMWLWADTCKVAPKEKAPRRKKEKLISRNWLSNSGKRWPAAR